MESKIGYLPQLLLHLNLRQSLSLNGDLTSWLEEAPRALLSLPPLHWDYSQLGLVFFSARVLEHQVLYSLCQPSIPTAILPDPFLLRTFLHQRPSSLYFFTTLSSTLPNYCQSKFMQHSHLMSHYIPLSCLISYILAT